MTTLEVNEEYVFMLWPSGELVIIIGGGERRVVLGLGAREKLLALLQPKHTIPMTLWCPKCWTKHVDEGEFSTKPHKTHECRACGLQWRPANVPTCGVDYLSSSSTIGTMDG